MQSEFVPNIRHFLSWVRGEQRVPLGDYGSDEVARAHIDPAREDMVSGRIPDVDDPQAGEFIVEPRTLTEDEMRQHFTVQMTVFRAEPGGMRGFATQADADASPT